MEPLEYSDVENTNPHEDEWSDVVGEEEIPEYDCFDDVDEY